MIKIHVDEEVTVRFNEDAENAFKNENDISFFDEVNGVAKVTIERWQKAQRTESKHWMELGKNANDDRNFYHLNKFKNLEYLKNYKFSHALEIGCGPFTNLRLIANKLNINKCSLNDPLIKTYFNHEFCSYKNQKNILLQIDNNGFLNKLFPKKLKVINFFSTPFEEIVTNQKFDLIVVINVIEHCYDIELFFSRLLNMLSPSGVVIFEDKLYDINKLKDEVYNLYDAAHPLRVSSKIVTDFLYNNIDVLFEKIEPNSLVIESNTFNWDDLYFVGKKR